MKLIPLITATLLAPLAMAGSTPPPTQAQTAQQARHLVVFNRTGPNWHRRAEFAVAAPEHRNIYLRLAEKGDILAGGRFEGEPALGISIFRQGIDEASIRKLLDDDRLVREGVVAVEYRRLGIQMGALSRARAN